MRPAITFTIDLEDPTGMYASRGRYVALTFRILDLCDELKRKATFFTIGRVAQEAPHLVKEIAARGHEIAYHSHNHVSLTKEFQDRFQNESRDDKDRLEQISGQNIIGFRAPRFSLTGRSLWALDILKDIGFLYSSSLMPTEISLFGFPDAPRTPFLWPNGMVEFPLPVAYFGKYRVPYLGGIYLYTMPFFFIRSFLSRALPQEALWTYTHPYDFDVEEKFMRMPNTALWICIILWLARRQASSKIRRVLEGSLAAQPLKERLAEASLSYQPNNSEK